jgi:small-conductance mechanosensitive channel
MDAMAIDVELQFRVTSPANRTPARNEIIDVVSQRCAAEGIALAMPALSYLVLPKANEDEMKTTAIAALSRAL